MAVRKYINIFVLVNVLSMVWLYGMNPLSISQQFNWSHQLIIVFFVHFCRFRSRYDMEATPTKSIGQETVFVGHDIVSFD